MARERIDFESNTDSLFLLADAPTGNLDSLRTATQNGERADGAAFGGPTG